MAIEMREGQLPSITLEQALTETTFRPGRIYQGPDVIDLGRFQSGIEKLFDFTLHHPHQHEAGRVLMFGLDGQLVESPLIEGGSDYTDLSLGRVAREFGRNIYSLNKLLSARIHTHSIDSTFSTFDLRGILSSDNVTWSSSAAEVLVGPQGKALVFRGPRTPQLGIIETERTTIAIQEALEKTIKEHGVGAETLEQRVSIVLLAQRLAFKSLATMLDFQVFKGGLRDRYLRRVIGDQIAV